MHFNTLRCTQYDKEGVIDYYHWPILTKLASLLAMEVLSKGIVYYVVYC